MFDSLRERLEGVFKGLKNRGKLTEEDISAALRNVRRALLEGDVNFRVARDLVEKIRERALGRDVLDSITPAQQVIAIVFEEISALMGGGRHALAFSSKPPSKYLLVGLQGSGKTTTCVKIAKKISDSHKPLVVACDFRRPAAVEQLRVLAQQAGIGFFGPEEGEKDARLIVDKALDYAAQRLYDVILFDTAGRLDIDEDLMDELASLGQAVEPTETLLVVDAMTGQEAVNVASAFHGRIPLTGIVLTKVDGDSRGGASLSVRAVTGVPVKFAGVGERIADLEQFDPDRMAQRILGMGDVQGLAEKVRQAAEDGDMEKIAASVGKKKMTMNDMLLQIRQVKKMGQLDKILEMIPGAGSIKGIQNAQMDPGRLTHVEAVILSMTRQERENPQIIKGSRRRRIALGSGTSVQMVNQVLKQFEQMNILMKRFGAGKKGMKLPKGFPPMPM
ncbi:MAG: signal recognition particle protein [Thermovirgaceae bacterium]|nr:signal recognition particle protein [Thermovirgaceae bacterium]